MKKRASQKNMIRKTALYTEVSFYEPSRFPGLQIIVLPNLLTYPLYAMVSYDNTPCLQ